MKKALKVLLIYIICYTNSYSQIDNFTLSVTPTDVTCTANGKLTFSVANTLTGSTVLYSIYRLPNVTTPIAVTNISPFTGLTPGTYRIVATQTLGSQSASKQQEVVILNLIATLTYQVTSEKVVCGNDGVLTVSISSGNPSQYEIISGPETRPLQSSNVFNNLPQGTYQIRVRDVCGEAVVQTHTLEYSNPALTITLRSASLASCTTVRIGFSFDKAFPTGTIKYPLQITTIINPPSATPITASSSVTSGNIFEAIYQLYSPQPYTYSFTIVDGCGVTYTLNGSINNLSSSVIYTINSQDCSHKQVQFNNASEVVLVTAPSSFSTALPINYTAQIINYSITINDLTAGNYVFNVIDLCGNPQVISFTITIDSSLRPYTLLYDRTCISSSVLIFNIQQLIMTSCPASYNVSMPHDYTNLINNANYAGFANLPIGVYTFDTIDLCDEPQPLTIVINPLSESPSATVLEGCDDGFGSIKIEGQMSSIVMIAAPSAYNEYSLPHDFMSSLISGGTALVLGSLPPGTYTFQLTNACGTSYTISKQVLGYQDNSTATVTPNCGSFTINLIENTNSSVNSYWLQKWNVATNSWVHPQTSVSYSNGSLPTVANSIELNLGTNLNFIFNGHFRVLKAYKTYITNTINSINCFEVLNEFDFSDQPKINGINSVSCNTTFEVIVDAEGIGNLIYRITLKNGQPFIIQNGNSNYFANLQPAVYNFQVEDSCGNIVNSIYEIINPLPFVIETDPIVCDFENVTLSVPNFSFLQYQWWKGTQTTTVLSTTSTLNFVPFSSAVNNGTYYVSIVYPGNPNSCLNQTLSYTIDFDPELPDAGTGQTVSYCGNQATIDLFTLLQGTYHTDGTWTEISNSGTLIDNLWDATTVNSGGYQFKYRVDGTCNQFEEALINITIFSIPETPIAAVDDVICETSDLNLYATTIPSVTYFWSGPNGFSSSLQNPLLTNISSTDNGIYTVYVTQNNCPSGTSEVEVLVNPLPDFSLNQECLNKEYVLTAITNDENYTFNWTGPNAYTSNQNPITITRGDTGLYSLTIINQNGCSTKKEMDVLRTFCEIPNVITPNNDTSNEDLNLIGFDVKKLEIYNRWGRLVFDKTNYTNEWHGQSNNGNKLPDGTYFYVIQYNNLESANGWIFVNGN